MPLGCKPNVDCWTGRAGGSATTALLPGAIFVSTNGADGQVATLADDDVRVDFSELTTPTDRVAVVATRPLTTNEVWTQGKPGELWVFDRGALRATLPSVAKPTPRARRSA